MTGVILLARFESPAARWRLWRTARIAIEQAAPHELVKLVGKVSVAEHLLRAPLTGRACTCWSLTIDDLGTEDAGRLVDINQGASFRLTDRDATIFVTPLFCRIIADASAVVTREFPRDAQVSLHLDRYLDEAADRGECQGALAMLRRGSPLRVREAIVHDGSTVAVLGLVETRTNSLHEEGKHITCPDNGPLLVSDVPSLQR